MSIGELVATSSWHPGRQHPPALYDERAVRHPQRTHIYSRLPIETIYPPLLMAVKEIITHRILERKIFRINKLGRTPDQRLSRLRLYLFGEDQGLPNNRIKGEISTGSSDFQHPSICPVPEHGADCFNSAVIGLPAVIQLLRLQIDYLHRVWRHNQIEVSRNTFQCGFHRHNSCWSRDCVRLLIVRARQRDQRALAG